MLPKYHAHMQRHGRKSLLTRFCGMYGVRIFDEDSLDHGQLHTFIVMNAVFPAEASRFISERFDLKGSTVGREVSEEELKKKGSDAVLKDLDLAREVELVRSVDANRPSTDYGLSIGATAKAALLSQLREDVKLLVDCQVMDYSLLVGVVNMDAHSTFDQSARKALEAIQEQGRLFSQSKRMDEKIVYALTTPVRTLIAPPLFMARQVLSFTQRTVSSIITLPLPYYGSGECGVDGGSLSVIHGTRRGDRAVYYMGLIDFLQPWTSRKYFERKLKGAMGYDTNAISCVTPEEYASRFLEFLDAHVS
jgi:1-phosphatidylinositol-4-phosphate 5-kinase